MNTTTPAPAPSAPTYVTLSVRMRRVASDTDDCTVRRAVVYRLHPDGRHLVEVRADEDPQAAHERDLWALQRAVSAGMWNEKGRAVWDGGPFWVESFSEGERWTPIPR